MDVEIPLCNDPSVICEPLMSYWPWWAVLLVFLVTASCVGLLTWYFTRWWRLGCLGFGSIWLLAGLAGYVTAMQGLGVFLVALVAATWPSWLTGQNRSEGRKKAE